MKSTYIMLAIALFSLALFTGKTTISICPFKVSIERPFYTIGHLLIVIGILCFSYQDSKAKNKKEVKVLTAKNLEEAQALFKKYTPNDAFIQWKGTDVCMDFTCECGRQNHYDGYFAYEVKCSFCQSVYAPSCNIVMIKIENPGDRPLEDTLQ